MEWNDVEFSVDLVESALRHLHFLDNVDNFEKLFTGTVLEHALRRYEQLWLPLADEHRSSDIVAPIDIAWIWYIHLLSPLAYRKDCRKMFKKTLNHEFKGDMSIIKSTNNAIEIWYSKYPKTGFNIIRNDEYVRGYQEPFQQKKSKISVNLLQNAESHIHFCYQVALPHFRDKKYLENALKRYKQFLCVKRMEPDEFLTPSVDIMLLWFTHMCNPIAYANDLMNICGRLLDNNIKVKPAFIDERFLLAREKTNTLWKKVSTEELVQPGTKLRSNANEKEIYPMTMDDLKECCVFVYNVYMTHAELTGLSSTKIRKSYLKIYRLYSEYDGDELVALKGKTKRMWTFSSKFAFNTAEDKGLSVMLVRKSKMCFQGDVVHATGSLDLRAALENLGLMERALTVDIPLKTPGDSSMQLHLDGALETAIPHLCALTLKLGSFEKTTLTSKALRRTWGNAALPQSVNTDDCACFVSCHVLVNHEGKDCFHSRVIHVPQLLRSGVEVFYCNKLVATSYVIGSSQLPSPAQVQWSDLSMAFDTELGERAMLIRNHKGDWGLCVARWITETGDSYLDVRFLKLVGTNKLQRLEVRSVDIEFQSFNGNIHSGQVQINPSNNTVGENLAIIWSVSMLYVLCAPRDPNRKLLLPRKVQTTNEDEEGAKTDKFVQESSCQFLLAAGLKTEIPSNEYVFKTYGSLTYDLSMDAEDIVVEEQKMDRKLFKRESKLLLRGDTGNSVKKLKKKKSSKLKESIDSMPEENMSDSTEKKDDIQLPNAISDPQSVTKKKTTYGVKDQKRKRIKRKESSNLDDILSVSEDSITKDDIEETELVKDKNGRIKVVKKMSSTLNEIPSDDITDKEEKELREYYEQLEKEHVSTISREETTVIRNVAERKVKERLEADTLLNRNVENRTVENGAEQGGVTFKIGENDTDNGTEDGRSDTSSITSETKRMRRNRIAQTRESLYPVSDNESTPAETAPIRSKRSKKKLQPKINDTGVTGREKLTEILEIAGLQEDLPLVQ